MQFVATRPATSNSADRMKSSWKSQVNLGLQVNEILIQTLSVSSEFPTLQANKLHTHCRSPVSILGVRAGSTIKARVTGVGRADSVGHFPGSTAAHCHRRHLYWDQGQRTWVQKAVRVTDAQLCETAAGCPTICVHTLVYLHLADVHAQQGLQLQRGGWQPKVSNLHKSTSMFL